jgi:hypothetical protein
VIAKNGEARTVAMHKKVRAALHKLFVAQGSPSEGMVFLTQRGVPYHDPRLYEKFPSGSPIKKGARDRRLPRGDQRLPRSRLAPPLGLPVRHGGHRSRNDPARGRYATVSAAHRTQAMRK